jgi:hypothetical protein
MVDVLTILPLRETAILGGAHDAFVLGLGPVWAGFEVVCRAGARPLAPELAEGIEVPRAIVSVPGIAFCLSLDAMHGGR